MGIVIILAVVLVLAIMVLVSQRQSVNNMKKLLRDSQDKTIQLEQKVESARNDLKKSREELLRGQSALKDARELSKKKLRRHAEQDKQNIDEAAMTNKITGDNDIAISALETQIENMKSDFDKTTEALRMNIEEEYKKKNDQSLEEIESYKKKISELQEEVKKQKRLMRPEGNKIDLKSLPDEAAGEFARVYRKAEHHERLHGIARAKLQLAQEKFTDLQKRYFAVCRELAVAVGKKEDITPVEAREVAESLVTEHEHPPQDESHEVKA